MRAFGAAPLVFSLVVAGLALGAGSTAAAADRYSLSSSPEPLTMGLSGLGASSSIISQPESDQDSRSRYRLDVRSTGDASALDDANNGFSGVRTFEAVGGYYQHLGAGFGYGLNLGLGMETRADWNDLGPSSESTSYFTDFSFGPTFASGRFDSQFRVGLRQPLSSEDRGLGFRHGDRFREAGRSASYLSLDGRLRLQNQSELSMSLYYDDYSLNSTDNWLADRLEFEGASSREPTSSVIGVEMGLTF